MAADDDVAGPPLREADAVFGPQDGEPPRLRRGRRRVWAAVVAGMVVFVALSVLAVLGFVAIMDPGLPSEKRLAALVSETPTGTVLVAEDEGCASAECWRTVTLTPPSGQSVVDVLDGMGVPSDGERCGITSWWDWRRTCVGARTSTSIAEVRLDPHAEEVVVYVYRRAVGD